ncbi:hypothetical protein EE612_046158 [Oryza sativa]|nr:hypothetical protein EE612_046158 [Oryza sativa]
MKPSQGAEKEALLQLRRPDKDCWRLDRHRSSSGSAPDGAGDTASKRRMTAVAAAVGWCWVGRDIWGWIELRFGTADLGERVTTIKNQSVFCSKGPSHSGSVFHITSDTTH